MAFEKAWRWQGWAMRMVAEEEHYKQRGQLRYQQDGGESQGRHGGWHQRSMRRGCAGPGGRMEELHFLLGSQGEILSRGIMFKRIALDHWKAGKEWQLEGHLECCCNDASETWRQSGPARSPLQWSRGDTVVPGQVLAGEMKAAIGISNGLAVGDKKVSS